MLLTFARATSGRIFGLQTAVIAPHFRPGNFRSHFRPPNGSYCSSLSPGQLPVAFSASKRQLLLLTFARATSGRIFGLQTAVIAPHVRPGNFREAITAVRRWCRNRPFKIVRQAEIRFPYLCATEGLESEVTVEASDQKSEVSMSMCHRSAPNEGPHGSRMLGWRRK